MGGLVRPGADIQLGQIEYRLAREGVVREFRRGRLSRLDVCDAQPELLRIARHHGSETPADCPICSQVRIVHVQFAFGPRLPASGRAITGPTELAKLAAARTQVVCYTVEVCPSCGWNHLVRMFALGGTRR
jgi:hypothetical protein